MPEPVITVILVIYQRYIEKKMVGLFQIEYSLVRSEWGAGKESVCVWGVI